MKKDILETLWMFKSDRCGIEINFPAIAEENDPRSNQTVAGLKFMINPFTGISEFSSNQTVAGLK